MAGHTLHAGVWACISSGLLLWHVVRFLHQPAFIAAPPLHGALPSTRQCGKAIVDVSGSQAPRQRRSDGGWALGLAGLGLVAGASVVGRTSASRASRRRRPCLRAEGKSPIGKNGKGEAAGGTGADTPEATPDELVEELESKMHKFARAGNFEAAAAVRDELSNSQVDDEAHVLLANAELYAAFSGRDLERMKALWLPASYVQCIHPYTKRTTGHTDVCKSWGMLFDVAKSRGSCISAEDVRVNVRGATATVTCTEQVKSKAQKFPLRSMLATNIFRKVDGRWYLVHRHVSAAGDAALGAPLLEDQPTAMDSPEASLAWHLQRMAQAAQRFPSAKIIIQDASSDNTFSDEEDEEFSPHHFEAAGMVEEDMDSDSGMESEDDSDLENMLVEEENEMESARDTVRALRRLSKEKLLTPKARIQLMSEMLQNPGESMPERAHELLLVEVPEDEKDAAWEDFAALVTMEANRIDAKKAKPTEAVEWKKPQRAGKGKGH
mmetsp:Transcript_15371/g.31222  ORF Transcript_15371/g.31222 Transcript_15371/m.31222 type:complete len:494 (+) Transcript_15371:93-1574(+)